MTNAKRRPFFCSFCGKQDFEVSVMVAGPTVFICNECVAGCAEVVARVETERADALANRRLSD